MRLGGFVIHGNNRATLGRCLDDLRAVCDRVVAVDSGSTDGSAELVRASGVEAIDHPWRGFGAARAVAAARLAGDVDYLFFLDADERLAPGGRERLLAWKAQRHELPLYTVRRKNLAAVGGRPFTYHRDTRARLVRRDCASWTDSMIVHEALPRLPNEASGVELEHDFALDLAERREKDERYALLWAIQARAREVRLKAYAPQRVKRVLVDLLIYGALWRGGLGAARLAWRISRYAGLKYVLLGAVRAGAFAELVQAYERGSLAELFAKVNAPGVPAQLEAVLRGAR